MKEFLSFIHRTKTQAILAFIIICGGMVMIALSHLDDSDKNHLYDLMLLTATFYFGSSKSGATKDETIANLAGSPTVGPVTTDNLNVVDSKPVKAKQ